MTDYTVVIRTGRKVPDDVLVEHVAAALRQHGVQSVRIESQREARNHPFEGGFEMFDDDVPQVKLAPGETLEDATEVLERAYPLLNVAIKQLKERGEFDRES